MYIAILTKARCNKISAIHPLSVYSVFLFCLLTVLAPMELMLPYTHMKPQEGVVNKQEHMSLMQSASQCSHPARVQSNACLQ